MIVLLLLCTHSAHAQGKFLTAQEVKPILTATKGNWIAVREYDGKDLLYFTHLLAWRCGLTSIQYALNDGGQLLDWPLTECDEQSPTPAAIGDDQKIYLTAPFGSIQSISVLLTYDDDTTDQIRVERANVLIP